MSGFVHPEYLVETDWLAQHLNDPNVLVFDCTTHLLPDPKITYQVKPGREDFEAGRRLLDDHIIAGDRQVSRAFRPVAEAIERTGGAFEIEKFVHMRSGRSLGLSAAISRSRSGLPRFRRTPWLGQRRRGHNADAS